MSLRNEQVSSVLRRAVQDVIGRGLSDPRIRGLVTVTGVDLSPDFAQAVVRVSIVPAEHAELTMHGLKHAARHIRTAVGRKVELRRMPRLVFKRDDSLKKQADVLSAIARAAERPAPDPPTEPEHP